MEAFTREYKYTSDGVGAINSSHTRRDSESMFGAVYCPQIENVKKWSSGPLHINFRSGIVDVCALWGIKNNFLGG